MSPDSAGRRDVAQPASAVPAEVPPAPRPRLPRVLAVATAFGVLYAYDLFEAISNLVGVSQLNALAAEAGVGPLVPWALPIAVLILPPLAFALALMLGRRRSLGMRALILLAGLGVVAALTLSITALA